MLKLVSHCQATRAGSGRSLLCGVTMNKLKSLNKILFFLLFLILVLSFKFAYGNLDSLMFWSYITMWDGQLCINLNQNLGALRRFFAEEVLSGSTRKSV